MGRARPTRSSSARAPGARVRDLRLHFVNTTGTATAARPPAQAHPRGRGRGRRRDRRRWSAATRSAQTRPARDRAAREQWGADACPPRAEPAYGEVKLAFIHHTVSANDYGPEDSAAMVLGDLPLPPQLERLERHRLQLPRRPLRHDLRGPRGRHRRGGGRRAGAGLQLASRPGIASLGTFSTAGQTDAGLGAIARLLSWKLARARRAAARARSRCVSGGGSTNRYPAGIAAPRSSASPATATANATACPGDGLYAQLPQLRAMVDPGPPRASTTHDGRGARAATSPTARRPVLRVGAGAAPGGAAARRAAGRRPGARAARLAHAPLASRPTPPAGRDALRLSLNRTLRARFARRARPAALELGEPVTVGVRPLVTVALGAAPCAGRARCA